MSEAKTVWHPYPDETPQSGDNYLITVEDDRGFRYVGTAVYMNVTGWLIDKRYKVIAWAERPEPYEPESKK